MKVNMTPNPLDVVTIHASQGDTEARQWEFELHNNGELIDTSDVKEQMVFKAYKGGTEQILPENTSTPTTSPFKGDIRYPQGLLEDQEFLYRQSPTEEDGYAKIETIYGNTLKWNQLLNVGTLTAQQGVVQDLTLSNNFNFVANHKYLLSWNQTVTMTSNTRNVPAYYDGANHYGDGGANNNLKKGIYTWIFAPTNTTSQGRIWLWVHTPNIDVPYTDIMLFDLTLLGIDSLTDAEILKWFADCFPLSYYAYNQGSLLSFMGNGINTVGKNQINLGVSKSATANGVTASYDASTQKVTLSGTNTKTDSAYILINFTPSAIPKFKIGETYVVSASSQIPTNTYFNLVYRDTNNALQGLSLTQIETRRTWRFTVPSNYSTFNSFQIGILKEARQLSGEFGVQLEFGNQATAYEPYTESVINLPISTYFPTGMKQAGNVYDELIPTKATTRMRGVDLGTLTFNQSSNFYYRQNSQDLGIKADAVVSFIAEDSNITSVYYYSNSGQFRVYVNDISIVPSGMLYYELATPTETSFTTASLVTENAEIPLSNEDGVLIGKCTEQLSSESGFFDAKIKLSDADGECYSNKLQLHVERSPQ